MTPRKIPAVPLDNAADQTGSRLLGLPAELRNRIYEMAFFDTVVVLPSIKKVSPKGLFKGPGILLACKQTYAEAVTLYYTLPTFEAYTGSRLSRWLRRIGAVRQEQVTKIHMFQKLRSTLDSTPPTYVHLNEMIWEAGWAVGGLGTISVQRNDFVVPKEKIKFPITFSSGTILWVNDQTEWLQELWQHLQNAR